jgi:hypothetical protein
MWVSDCYIGWLPGYAIAPGVILHDGAEWVKLPDPGQPA